MLAARNLVKRFFGVTVVDDVSFVVRPGEVVGCLGPNGSGKTTIARMLTGLLEPSEGTVLWHESDISENLIPFRACLGYVPEEPHLYPFLSGREYLELVGRLREMEPSALERKISSLVQLFGLRSAVEQAISSYSKGMKQKILIIAALLHNPDVLVFDEPDAGLDITAMLTLRHLAHTLARQGKAVLYGSHVVDVIERLSTRVIVLHQGRIVANDSVEELRRLMTSRSLEDVFSQLVLRDNPEQTAREIADVVVADA